MRDFITSASAFAGMPEMGNLELENMPEEQQKMLKDMLRFDLRQRLFKTGKVYFGDVVSLNT